MSHVEPLIGEFDLHAYVDGQLPAHRRLVVRHHLDLHPEDARRVAAWTAQRDGLRAALAWTDIEPLPARLNLLQLLDQRLYRRWPPWYAAAAVVLALLLGAAGGWMVRAPDAPPRELRAMSLLQHQALITHIVYAADQQHPIEIAATEKEHLARWLSNRLGRTVEPPELSAIGYQLIGGRLLATESGNAAALLMYENRQGDRLSVVLRPMSRDLKAAQVDMAEGPINGCAWIADGLGYAVVAALPDGELDVVSTRIRAHEPG